MPDTTRFVRSRAGLTYRLNPDGTRTLLVPSGGSGDDDTSAGADDNGSAGTQSDGKVLTQQQLDSIVGRATRKAENDAKKQIEEQLGMPISDLASFVEQTKKADEERMTAAQLAEKRATERETAAAAALAEAAGLVTRTRVMSAMVREGLDLKAAERLAPTIQVDPDSDDETIAAAVAGLREELPALFAPNGATPPPTPGRGQRPAGKATPPASDADAFAEQWVQRQASGAGALPTL